MGRFLISSGTGIGKSIVSGNVVHDSTVDEIKYFFVPGSALVCCTTGTDMIAYIEKAGAVVDASTGAVYKGIQAFT